MAPKKKHLISTSVLRQDTLAKHLMELHDLGVTMLRAFGTQRSGKKTHTQNGNPPWKINMDHNHGGLEDHFPF